MTANIPPSIDGISPPAPDQPPAEIPSPAIKPPAPKKKGTLNGATMGFIILAILYILPAFMLMLLFPRMDGTMQNIRMGGMAAYGLGAAFWLLFGLFGFMRITTYKDHPRTQIRALIRLLAYTIPLVIISGTTLYMISRPAQIPLDIVSPTNANDIVAPVSITFSAQSADKIFEQQQMTPLKYDWDFLNNGQATQQTFDPQATFTYAKAGIYTVSVTITMRDGQTKKLTHGFVISQSSFAIEPPSPVIDEPARFDISNLIVKKEDFQKVQWDFDGDGVVDKEGTTMDGTFTYHKLATYTPNAVLFFVNGTQTTLRRNIQIVNPPKLPFAITLQTDPATLIGPPPFPVTFTLQTKEPIAEVNWTFGDNKTADGMIVQHIYKDIGSFTATAVVRSQSGATARLSKVVQVPDALQLPDLTFDGLLNFNGDTITGEVPLTLELTPITSSPLVSFSWDAPGASDVSSTDGTLKATYRREGNYFLELIASDPDNHALRKRFKVNVTAASSVVSFTMDPQAPEAPASVAFDASDTYISPDESVTGFEWDFGDGSNNSNFAGSRIDHVYDKPGTYTITLNVHTTAGKVYTGKQSLVVRAPLIRACFLASRTKIKAPTAVNFDPSCSTGSFTSWLWDYGDNSQSDLQNPPPHIFTTPGDYTVSLTASTKDGRSDTYKLIISVTQ